MKKLLLTLIIALSTILPTTALALEGTISTVQIENNGDARVRLLKTTGGETGNILLVGTTDAQKAMLASVLTAKSSGATVDLWYGTVSGVSGWTSVILK